MCNCLDSLQKLVIVYYEFASRFILYHFSVKKETCGINVYVYSKNVNDDNNSTILTTVIRITSLFVCYCNTYHSIKLYILHSTIKSLFKLYRKRFLFRKHIWKIPSPIFTTSTKFQRESPTIAKSFASFRYEYKINKFNYIQTFSFRKKSNKNHPFKSSNAIEKLRTWTRNESVCITNLERAHNGIFGMKWCNGVYGNMRSWPSALTLRRWDCLRLCRATYVRLCRTAPQGETRKAHDKLRLANHHPMENYPSFPRIDVIALYNWIVQSAR